MEFQIDTERPQGYDLEIPTPWNFKLTRSVHKDKMIWNSHPNGASNCHGARCHIKVGVGWVGGLVGKMTSLHVRTNLILRDEKFSHLFRVWGILCPTATLSLFMWQRGTRRMLPTFFPLPVKWNSTFIQRRWKRLELNLSQKRWCSFDWAKQKRPNALNAHWIFEAPSLQIKPMCKTLASWRGVQWNDLNPKQSRMKIKRPWTKMMKTELT